MKWMRHRDEKQLLFFFVGIQFLLLGLIVWNLHYQVDTSDAVIGKAKETFLREVPRLLTRENLPVHFRRIESGADGLANVVFSSSNLHSPEQISKRITHILGLRFTVTDQVRKENLLLFGVGFHGVPVGRLVIQAAEIQPAGEVGIIIDDFGYDKGPVVNGFLRLPTDITLSIIPGHEYSREIARAAYSRGFEVMIHMPMEPENYEGGEKDFILMSNMPSREIISRLNRAFEEIPHAAGLNNHEGSLATQNTSVMQTVLQILRDRNMYFIDSYTAPESIGYLLAEKLDMPCGKRSVFLDNQEDTTAIRGQIEELVKEARRKGRAIGIGHEKAPTLTALQKYIPFYQARGIRFVRISELIEQPILAEQSAPEKSN